MFFLIRNMQYIRVLEWKKLILCYINVRFCWVEIRPTLPSGIEDQLADFYLRRYDERSRDYQLLLRHFTRILISWNIFLSN